MTSVLENYGQKKHHTARAHEFAVAAPPKDVEMEDIVVPQHTKRRGCCSQCGETRKQEWYEAVGGLLIVHAVRQLEGFVQGWLVLFSAVPAGCAALGCQACVCVSEPEPELSRQSLPVPLPSRRALSQCTKTDGIAWRCQSSIAEGASVRQALHESTMTKSFPTVR